MNQRLIWLLMVLIAIIILLTLQLSLEPFRSTSQSNHPIQINRMAETPEHDPSPDRRKRERPPTERKHAKSDARVDQIRVQGTYENSLAGELFKPLDAAELTRLSEDPDRDIYRFTDLILQAAAEKDSSFRQLVDRKDLRAESRVDLAISAYDYMINGNPAALESILGKFDKLAAEGRNGDSDELMVLAYVDEWDATRETLLSHGVGGDGAGGDAVYAFWLKRRFLFPNNPVFPKDYEAFKTEIFQSRRAARRREQEAEGKTDPP